MPATAMKQTRPSQPIRCIPCGCFLAMICLIRCLRLARTGAGPAGACCRPGRSLLTCRANRIVETCYQARVPDRRYRAGGEHHRIRYRARQPEGGQEAELPEAQHDRHQPVEPAVVGVAGSRCGQQQHHDRRERDHTWQLPHPNPGEQQDGGQASDGRRQRHQVPEQPAPGPPRERAIIPAGQHDILAYRRGGKDRLGRGTGRGGQCCGGRGCAPAPSGPDDAADQRQHADDQHGEQCHPGTVNNQQQRGQQHPGPGRHGQHGADLAERRMRGRCGRLRCGRLRCGRLRRGATLGWAAPSRPFRHHPPGATTSAVGLRDVSPPGVAARAALSERADTARLQVWAMSAAQTKMTTTMANVQVPLQPSVTAPAAIPP